MATIEIDKASGLIGICTGEILEMPLWFEQVEAVMPNVKGAMHEGRPVVAIWNLVLVGCFNVRNMTEAEKKVRLIFSSVGIDKNRYMNRFCIDGIVRCRGGYFNESSET